MKFVEQVINFPSRLNSNPWVMSQLIAAKTISTRHAARVRWERWSKRRCVKSFELLEDDLRSLGYKIEIVEIEENSDEVKF